MRTKIFSVLCLASILGGCVVAPAPVYRQPGPTYSGPVMVDHGVPPIEYVEGGAPVYYETEPGVAFYPIFLDAPGSCFCIVPMRYAGGVWLGVGGAVLYRGHFPYHHAPPQHREIWLRSGGEIGGHRPMPGRIEREGNVMRALPPPGSIHAQDASRQIQGAQPRQQSPISNREAPVPKQQGSASQQSVQQVTPNNQFRQQQVQQTGQQRPLDVSGGQQGRPQQPPAAAVSQSRQQQPASNARQEHDRHSEHKCSKEEHEAKKC
jgi:hypothetical protein